MRVILKLRGIDKCKKIENNRLSFFENNTCKEGHFKDILAGNEIKK